MASDARAVIGLTLFLVFVSVSAEAQQKQPKKPRGAFNNPDAYLLDSPVSYWPDKEIIEGMIVAGSERVITLTSARFCQTGAGKLVSEDGKLQENVYFGGDQKSDLLFKVLCDTGLRRREAYLRAALEEQRRVEAAEQERRDYEMLNAIACATFPERCR
jgi:hypothetical protein